MPTEKFLKKCRLNGMKPSTRLPNKAKLCQSFSDIMKLSSDQLPRSI